MQKLCAIGFVSLLTLVAACGAPPPTDTGSGEQACYLTPDKPECSCDDNDPCTVDTREFDGCKNDAVPFGEPCVGQPGVCGAGGACVLECASKQCNSVIADPSVGCIYSPQPNGWNCVDESGVGGLCDDGACLIPHDASEACKWKDDTAPCSYGSTNGVCNNGVCVPRTAPGCVAQETKCQTEQTTAGWCGTWEWPTSDLLYCRACEEIVCLGVPGCSPIGDKCQGGDGEGQCPVGCCPICY